MLDNLTNQWAARLTPHAHAFAVEAREWCTCIVAELRAIRQTIADDDSTIFVRQVTEAANLPGGFTTTLTGTPNGEIPVHNNNGAIPASEEWELEFCSIQTVTTAATVGIYRNGILVVSGAANPTGKTAIGNVSGLRFQGGDQVGYEAAGAAPCTVNIYMQWRVKKATPSRSIRVAPAYENPTPNGGSASDRDINGDAARHESIGVFQGMNVVGTAKAQADGTIPYSYGP